MDTPVDEFLSAIWDWYEAIEKGRLKLMEVQEMKVQKQVSALIFEMSKPSKVAKKKHRALVEQARTTIDKLA